VGCPAEVQRLVERFERESTAYRAGAYNETQVRREFLDPFFKALGWDIDNEAGYAEAYKDVVHEDAIKVGGLTKAPDYCFRIGGTRKFFVEAKKPAVNIKDDVSPAFQLRRYAWSAKLPLSVLTDFQEFAVYDCRVCPDKADAAATARTIYMPYTKYDDRWEEIASIFSKDAVLQGSFDRYAGTTKGKKGTAEVDAAFLKEIEEWRSNLARTIALRNPTLTQRELNFAVQTTIDRIIFLRICEDRGIENYGELQGLCNGANTYARLLERFQKADQRYNSGLFHFERERGRGEAPDTLTPGLTIDDKALKDILRRLYYPDSPYEFSVLPADILGQVYEQFLGKVIRLTASHRAVVEDKPEVKKAGGVYYTPTYIVDYIVKNTVGRLLEDSTPKKAAGLRILDPACGSGSFLIGAFQYVVNWHRDWYVEDGPRKHTKEIFLGPGGEWRLTTAEKKRILLNNIYGVDIDSQAVETTKLSLLLKVLEGETQETINAQLSFLRVRALPDLTNNIKCGNSLIGPDFYEGRQLGLLDDEERYRINVFDWEAEFPQILGKTVPEAARGFDAVIGNPPYVRQESLSSLKDYLARRYAAYQGTADLYIYFVERGFRLLRREGRLGYIVSSSYLRATYGSALRSYLAENAALLSIVDFGGLAVFANAKDTYVSIPLLLRGNQPENVRVYKVAETGDHALAVSIEEGGFAMPSTRLEQPTWSLESEARLDVMRHLLETGVPLGTIVGATMCYGIKTGLNEAFMIDGECRNRLVEADPASAEIIKPLVAGRDIRKWRIDYRDSWIVFTRRGIDLEAYPAVRDHLAQFRSLLEPRPLDWPASRTWPGRKPGSYKWYEIQDDVAYYEVFDRPKIVYPDIAKGPRFCLDTTGSYIANTAYCLGTDDRYLLAFLNSRLAWFCVSNISIPFGVRAGEYRYRMIYQYMQQVPVFWPSEWSGREGAVRDRIVALANGACAICDRLSRARVSNDSVLANRELIQVERQIDSLFYELCGLTQEEIATVETGAGSG
jgi:Eco57I restriction-modification methylase/TaqI-like C-terminal specificity domain/Type I restriction enzyme R protein N terminus (HSDR_N)